METDENVRDFPIPNATTFLFRISLPDLFIRSVSWLWILTVNSSMLIQLLSPYWVREENGQVSLAIYHASKHRTHLVIHLSFSSSIPCINHYIVAKTSANQRIACVLSADPARTEFMHGIWHGSYGTCLKRPVSSPELPFPVSFANHLVFSISPWRRCRICGRDLATSWVVNAAGFGTTSCGWYVGYQDTLVRTGRLVLVTAGVESLLEEGCRWLDVECSLDLLMVGNLPRILSYKLV